MNTPNASNHAAAERRMNLSRRRFLRGLGLCIALPAFESLGPLGLLATRCRTEARRGQSRAGQDGLSLRAQRHYSGGLVAGRRWRKRLSNCRPRCSRCKRSRSEVQVISGLEDLSANAGMDGGGDHARAGGTFLTGVRIKKTAGSDIYAGVSFDQVIAQRIGHQTRFPSLELTCDAVRKAGDCDSGYSCAYEYNLAWRSPTQPVMPDPNPRQVFERLFGDGPRASGPPICTASKRAAVHSGLCPHGCQRHGDAK